MSELPARRADHEVDPLFVARWSHRAFASEPIPESVLLQAFEAARWAPSGGNAQPWRFLYARRGQAHWSDFLAALNERNRKWAGEAAALVAILSRTVHETEAGTRPHRSHSFDAGAAWSNFAHQAHLLGWTTRAMGGFDAEVARRNLKVPEDYAIEVFVAIGRPADASVLPEDFRGLEKPTGRKPVAELVREGLFAF